MITAACILVVAVLSMWATRAWMIADVEDAERDRDRASTLARHYRQKYLDAITGVPVSTEADELWQEFNRGHR
jgi:hypothetical protein